MFPLLKFFKPAKKVSFLGIFFFPKVSRYKIFSLNHHDYNQKIVVVRREKGK